MKLKFHEIKKLFFKETHSKAPRNSFVLTGCPI